MKFLADENFPNTSVFLLEDNKYVVRKVSILFKGISDSQIIDAAYKEDEIIITFDKDFGELIFKEKLPFPAGIILFRLKHFAPGLPAEILLDKIKNHHLILEDYFTVISKDKIRQKRLRF